MKKIDALSLDECLEFARHGTRRKICSSEGKKIEVWVNVWSSTDFGDDPIIDIVLKKKI